MTLTAEKGRRRRWVTVEEAVQMAGEKVAPTAQPISLEHRNSGMLLPRY